MLGQYLDQSSDSSVALLDQATYRIAQLVLSKFVEHLVPKGVLIFTGSDSDDKLLEDRQLTFVQRSQIDLSLDKGLLLSFFSLWRLRSRSHFESGQFLKRLTT